MRDAAFERLAVGGFGDQLESARGHGGVGRGFKDDGDGIDVAEDGAGGHHHARRERARRERDIAAEIVALHFDERGVAVALRHGNRLPVLRVLLHLRQPHGNLGFRRHHLDAVGESGPAATELVFHGDAEITVRWHLPAQVAVRPAAVVVLRDAVAFFVVDFEHGIERRTQPAGKDIHVEFLVFLRGEFEKIHVAFFADDAVEGERQRLVRTRRGRGVVVRFGFQNIRKR